MNQWSDYRRSSTDQCPVQIDELVVWLQKVKYWPVSSTNRWTSGLTTEGQVVTSVQYKQLNQWSDYRRSSTDQCPVQTDKPVVWLQKVKYWPVSGIKWWTSGLTTEGQVLTSVWYKVMNQWSDYRRSSIDQCPVPRDMNRLVWLQKASIDQFYKGWTLRGLGTGSLISCIHSSFPVWWYPVVAACWLAGHWVMGHAQVIT